LSFYFIFFSFFQPFSSHKFPFFYFDYFLQKKP
jgi:hypothetical protein